MPTIAIYTLGCKVNQYESQKLAKGFMAKGFRLVDFSEEADVYIINTCTVTQVADSKSRQVIRAAMRRNPAARVVVTGCYAERSRSELEALGVYLIVGNQGKAQLVDLIANIVSIASTENSVILPQNMNWVQPRTRALLKIQDGCNQFCSYCAVPFARPVMSCVPMENLLEEATSLVQLGHLEIVLTGIRLGTYKDGHADLITLLSALSELPQLERIRMSSIELTDIPDGLLDLMCKNRKICRHLHVPLQSGDDNVLRRMNRPYTAGEFTDFVRRARERIPDIAITTDIMVGFPGETIDEFENSYALAKSLKFSRMHVFRYSRRPGTAASELEDDVSDFEKDRRSRHLIELGKELSCAFAESFIGKPVSVLVEEKKVDGLRSGLTDNYVRVIFRAPDGCAGRIVNVRVQSVQDGSCVGEVCESEA